MKIYTETVLKLRDSGKTWEEIEEEYNKIHNDKKKANSLRAHYSRHRDRDVEALHNSNKYQELATNEAVTKEQLIEMHGYNSEEWELTSSNSTRSKIGTGKNEEQYFVNTYSKITVKPKEWKLTEEQLQEMLKVNVKPKTLKRTVNKGSGLYEIPLFDMHFGNMTFEEYENTQQEIANYILSKEWETIVFVIGQDLFHNDDFRGRTTSGTPIEKENMEKAWEDVFKFYIPLIELALENSKNVHIIYSRGNHDETLGWAFVKTLEKLYPQATFDTKQEEHKTFKYHNIWLGYTHGDKINDKKIVRYFEALYRLDMAKASRRVIKRGHLHTHKQFDDNGTHVIALGTGNKADQWHIDNGFVGNHKAFETFIYNEDSMKAHIFID